MTIADFDNAEALAEDLASRAQSCVDKGLELRAEAARADADAVRMIEAKNEYLQEFVIAVLLRQGKFFCVVCGEIVDSITHRFTYQEQHPRWPLFTILPVCEKCAQNDRDQYFSFSMPGGMETAEVLKKGLFFPEVDYFPEKRCYIKIKGIPAEVLKKGLFFPEVDYFPEKRCYIKIKGIPRGRAREVFNKLKALHQAAVDAPTELVNVYYEDTH